MVYQESTSLFKDRLLLKSVFNLTIAIFIGILSLKASGQLAQHFFEGQIIIKNIFQYKFYNKYLSMKDGLRNTI